MNIAAADSLMAIFGLRRASTDETEQTAEHSCLCEGGALHDPTHPASGKLISCKPVKLDACTGEVPLF